MDARGWGYASDLTVILVEKVRVDLSPCIGYI